MQESNLPFQEQTGTNPLESNNSNIEEIDLTHLDLIRLQEALTDQLLQNRLLHGRTTGNRTVLPTRNLTDSKGMINAAFATEQPLIALVRGTAGQRLLSWKYHIFFEVDSLQNAFNSPSFIYLVPRDAFVTDSQDKSEYISRREVPVLGRISFSTAEITPLLRTKEEVKQMIDPTTGMIDASHIRETDISTALLTIRNMLQLIGPLDSSLEIKAIGKPIVMQIAENRLERLRDIANTLQPVLKVVNRMGTPQQKELAQSVYNLYYANTYEIYNDDNFLFTTMNSIIKPIFEVLKLPEK